MTYSRYLSSRFYTFWAGCDEGKPDTKENQLFCVDCEHYITYERLKNDIEACLDEANTPTENPANAGYGKDPAVLREELKNYMCIFLEDMDCNFTEYKKRFDERNRDE